MLLPQILQFHEAAPPGFIDLRMFITGAPQEDSSSASSSSKEAPAPRTYGSAPGISARDGRILAADLKEAVRTLGGPQELNAFVCGPNSLVKWAAEELEYGGGVEGTRVHAEKWW